MRDGPAIPSSEFLCVTSFNARRLWQRDQSVHDGFRVFSEFLLENHVGVVWLAISRRHPLISHTHTMVPSVPEDEKQHFWFVQACVVLLSREWRIPPVFGGGCSTVLGAHVHTVFLMQGCHRRPVSVFGGILSLLLSVCRMQSAFQWSSPETPTCGIISTSLDPDRAMCLSYFFWICSWFCRLELCNPPGRANPHLRRSIGLHLHFFRSCCGRCGARWVAMLHRFLCVLPSVGVRPLFVRRSWSISSTRPDPVRGPIGDHFDPRACKAPSVECASP